MGSVFNLVKDHDIERYSCVVRMQVDGEVILYPFRALYTRFDKNAFGE